MPRRRRLLWAASALAALVLLTACRVDVEVDVAVEENGHGVVVVTFKADDDAVEAVPELASGLLLDDARDAGWEVADAESADGEITLRAQKVFRSAGQLQSVLAELAGPGVIFSGVELRQRRSFAETGWQFNATVDPTPPLEAFSDASLAAALDGHHFGRPIDDLLASGGAPEDFFGLTFSLTLPAAPVELAGTDDASAGVPGETAAAAGEISGSRIEWSFSYGDAPALLKASALSEHASPAMWLNISRAAAAAFGIALLGAVLAWVVAVIRTPKGRSRRAVRRRKQRAAIRDAEARKPRQRLLRLLVVDVHGVIVRPTDPLQGLLLPTIQAELSDIDPEIVRDRHRKLLLGRLTPDEFWSDLGLGPIAQGVETRYLSSYRLVPGLHEFLDRVAARNLPVAVVGNQPRRWGERLRRMAQLEDSTAMWMTSAEVGAVLPSPSLLEATRRKMSIDVHDCLYLSSVPEFLDAAELLGMNTAYFAASPNDLQETSHTVVRGFDDILRARRGTS